MQSVTININGRCPLSCAHCMVGFSPSNQGSQWRIDPDVLVRMIRSLDRRLCQTVLLAGGEPTMDRDLIRQAVQACEQAGVKIGIISAPIWAATADGARRLFDAVGRLDVLILSYDQYHLEFLAFRNYENAVREAVTRGTAVSVHICYSTERERHALEDSVRSLRPMLRGISAMRVFPYGNAVRPGVIQHEAIVLNDLSDLDRVPRSCIVGAAVVDDANRVHGCCWSVIAERSPFAREVHEAALDVALRDIEKDDNFLTLRTNGFLNSLTAVGRAEVLARLRGQAVTQECEVCVRMMSDETASIWQNGLIRPRCHAG
jgi:organic radical activating enzyme